MLLSFQPSLFGDQLGHADLSFEASTRHQLDETSWIDYVPGWLHGNGDLFEDLLRAAPPPERPRAVFDLAVREPQPLAWWDLVDDGALPARLTQVRTSLCQRYAARVDSTIVTLYRDGRDALPWRSASSRAQSDHPHVFTVALGRRRRLRVRPRGGGRAVLELRTGEGDLVVMGGRTRHDYEHAVPRERRVAEARISITMRHSIEDNLGE